MKKNVFKVLIALVFLVLFNTLFFYLGGTEQTKVNWICYGFLHASYISLLLTPIFCKSGKGLEVLAASLYLRALFYFFTELVIAVSCIAIAPESPMWPLIIQSVLLAIFLILQMMSVLANDATINSVQKQREESLYIQDMSQRIKTCMRDVSDPMLKKKVGKCYDAVNNCSLQSFPEAKNAEGELRNAVEILCSKIECNNCECLDADVQKVLKAVQNRNDVIRRCRMN